METPNVNVESLLLQAAILVLIAAATILLANRKKSVAEKIEHIGGNDRWKKAALIAVIIYFAVFSSLSILKYASYNMPSPDLHTFENVLWNTANGRFFLNDHWDGANFLGIHTSFILLLLLPFYMLAQSPITLLLLQTLAIALGALPIFLFAREKLKSEFAGFAFVLAYLLFPALQFINLREFHPEVFAIPFFGLAFWFLHKKNYKPFGLMLALALACKESYALVGAFLGVYVFFKHSKKIGAIVFAGSVVWFVLATSVIIPYFSVTGDYLFVKQYSNLGNSFTEIALSPILKPVEFAKTILIPQKLGYLFMLFAPLAFLSLFSPAILIALPAIMQNLLSSNPYYSSIYFQYNIEIIPFIFFSAVCGICSLSKRFRERNRQALAIALLLAVITTSFASSAFFGPSPLGMLNPFESPGKFDASKYSVSDCTKDIDRALSLLPKDSSISANPFAFSHTAKRRKWYEFPEGIPDGNADYALFSKELSTKYKTYERDLNEFEFLDSRDSQYERIFSSECAVLLRRKG